VFARLNELIADGLKMDGREPVVARGPRADGASPSGMRMWVGSISNLPLSAAVEGSGEGRGPMKRRPFLGLLGWLALSAAAGPAAPFPHFSGRQAGPDHRSAFLAVGLSRLAPAFSVFTVDSLGRGRLDQNPALQPGGPVAGLELEVEPTGSMAGRCGRSSGASGP